MGSAGDVEGVFKVREMRARLKWLQRVVEMTWALNFVAGNMLQNF